MAWNTATSYSSGAALTAAIIGGIGQDLRTWGGNVDADANSLTNLLAITPTSSHVLTVGLCRTYLQANSEVYALGLYYNGAGTPFFLGSTSSGDLVGSEAGGAERFRVTSGGGVKCPNLPSASPGAGTKQLWYDPADGNRIKFAA